MATALMHVCYTSTPLQQILTIILFVCSFREHTKLKISMLVGDFLTKSFAYKRTMQFYFNDSHKFSFMAEYG
jgi:hypothetical protein